MVCAATLSPRLAANAIDDLSSASRGFGFTTNDARIAFASAPVAASRTTASYVPAVIAVGLNVIVSFAGAVSADSVAEIHPLVAASIEATRPATGVVVPAVISISRVLAAAPDIDVADSVSPDTTIVAGGAFGGGMITGAGSDGASAFDEHWTVENVNRKTAVERNIARRMVPVWWQNPAGM
jgi:hypothetical protein